MTSDDKSSTAFQQKGKGRLVFALDVPDGKTALSYVEKLQDCVGVFKVGLELFTGAGPELVREMVGAGVKVFLDLKCHDIPATVRRAAAVAASLDVAYLTVHAADGPDLLKAAVEGAGPRRRPEILAITVLTSVKPETIRHLGFDRSLEEMVIQRAQFAASAQAAGLVCSPREVSVLRKELGPDILLVTPGVRPAGPKVKNDDQARTATPGSAIEAGANMVVVGRPIRDAADPAAAAAAIAEELGEAAFRLESATRGRDNP